MLVTWGFPRRMSQDQRVTVWVGGNLKAHLIPTPCHVPGCRSGKCWDGTTLCEPDIPKSLLTGLCSLRFGVDLEWLLFGADLSQILALTEPGGCFELGDDRMVWAAMGWSDGICPLGCSPKWQCREGRTASSPRSFPSPGHLEASTPLSEAYPHPHLLMKL